VTAGDVAGSAEPSLDRDARVLAARAAALAQQVGDTVDRSDDRIAVVVSVSGQRVAIAADDVDEVLVPAPLTRLPGAGRLIGVRNVRGRLIPLVELADLLGVGSSRAPSDAWTVVLAHPDSPVGLLVDAAEGLIALHGDSITAPTDQHERSPVLGVAHDGVFVLDAHRVLAHPDLEIGTSSPR